MGRQPGQYGGTLRTLIGSQKDIRLMTIYGYARLVGYDEKLKLQPDILESFDVADDRVFTFKMRDGHKWSDGSLLTPEDFRYCWEDVWLNDELSQGGLAPALLVGRQAAALRDRRSVDGPLQLGRAQSRLPAEARCAAAAIACSAGRLPEAVPQEIPGSSSGSPA